MKLQHMSVIFVIIILPIVLVMSEYMRKEVDAINIQSQYDARLLTATYDAVKAFQLNTINNKYSSVSDSKIRDVQASINTFYNSLEQNFNYSIGQSKEDFENYIPAVLYTMYDGFYIYGKYDNYYTSSKGIGTYTDPSSNPVSHRAQYGLRPFVYYSQRYIDNSTSTDVIINYSLDNQITVSGYMKATGDTSAKYYYRKGYLIATNVEIQDSDWELYQPLKDNGEINLDPTSWYKDPLRVTIKATHDKNGTYNEDIVLLPEVTSENIIIMPTDDQLNDSRTDNDNPYLATYEYTYYNSIKIYYDPNGYHIDGLSNYSKADGSTTNNLSEYQNAPMFFYCRDNKKIAVSARQYDLRKYLDKWSDNGRDHLKNNLALRYYLEAKEFSEWVQSSSLSNLTQDMAVDGDGNKINLTSYITKEGTDDESRIFAEQTGNKKFLYYNPGATGDSADYATNDPLNEDSLFNINRRAVIRRMIESDLAVEIANYTAQGGSFQYAMPELKNSDWEKICSDVSITTFMQGAPIGAKIYNSYYVVSCDLNKEAITNDSIYILSGNWTSNHDAKYTGDYYVNEAHRPNCSKIKNASIQPLNYPNPASGYIQYKDTESISSSGFSSPIEYRFAAGYAASDFVRQSVERADEISQSKSYYRHPEKRCYNCIVNVKGTFELNSLITGFAYTYNDGGEVIPGETFVAKSVPTANNVFKLTRIHYLAALAREKWILAKTL